MADADRISNLPTDVTELILTYLPTREAVRTSILSKRWRYKWTTIPLLVFDKNCCPNSSNDKAVVGSKLVSTINCVLSLHTGPIESPKLSRILSVPDIGCWILRASRSAVKELVVDVLDKREELPCSLYACNSLIRLELINCVLRPPSTFKGFKNLKTLDLLMVALTDDAFESLISGCPLLDKLCLTSSYGLNNLKINAPNLQSLVISCNLENIVFGDAHVKLSVISIVLRLKTHTKRHVDVTRFFNQLPAIERLVLGCHLLEYLCFGSIPERLPTPCFGLRHLSICIDLKNGKESLAALCILRSSPNLTDLKIKGACHSRYLESSDWLDENKCPCPLDKLQTVKIGNLLGVREELGFIQFVLMNSPALRKMYVSGCVDKLNFFIHEMPRLKKGSSQAEIVFRTKDPWC